MNKIGIITFEKYEGRRNIGSSRIRGRWLVDKWENAELFKQGEKYDVVIYQKAYWVEHARLFKGIKILDLCDPDWLHWGYRTKEMIENVDAITTSTEALAEGLRQFTDKPVICIPDRINQDYFRKKKQHAGRATYVGWFGYSSNFEMLQPVITFLIKNSLNLIVVSDGTFSPQSNNVGKIKVLNKKWSETTVHDDLLTCDFLINPQAERGKWKYKSNNKTLTGWALGLPVASNVSDLTRFLSQEEREKEAKTRLNEINEKWDISRSIEEYTALISELEKTKKV